MTLLLVSPYKKFDTNKYVELLADAYMQEGIQVIFEEHNFLFSNFVPDIIHIQWPEAIYRARKLISMDSDGLETLKRRLEWFKKNKTTIVYTVHNLLPHDIANEFDQNIYNLVLKYADVIVHHGKSSIEIIKQHHPHTVNKKHIISPHGPYQKMVLPQKYKTKTKYGLPLDKVIYTNFGKQRSYKGQDFCQVVFENWQNDHTCFFSIGQLIGKAKPIDNKTTNFCSQYVYKNVKDDEIPDVIASTDAFFLGHTSGLNSGIIALALTYSKPIIFPDIGNFKDQVEGWELYETYQVNNVNSAIEALNRMQKKIEGNFLKFQDNKKWAEINSWQKHIRNILNYCDK